jgi:hypothetical protein
MSSYSTVKQGNDLTIDVVDGQFSRRKSQLPRSQATVKPKLVRKKEKMTAKGLSLEYFLSEVRKNLKKSIGAQFNSYSDNCIMT